MKRPQRQKRATTAQAQLSEVSMPTADPITQAAMKNPDIPHLYANGVAFVGSNSDYCMIVLHNNLPVATINMSFTVAKSVGVGIGELVVQLESKTGHEIMTMDDIGQKMAALATQS